MTQVDPPPKDPMDRCWLTFPAIDKRPKARLRGYCLSNSEKDDEAKSYANISDITRKEAEAIQSMLLGGSYITCIKGRLHAFTMYEELPDPVDDPMVAPHWKSDGSKKEMVDFGCFDDRGGWHSPAIRISGVGAGAVPIYDEPKRSYRILHSCGFVCLRSKKGEDGRYWEDWVLHSLTMAEGDLKYHMERWSKENEINVSGGKGQWLRLIEEACRYIAEDLRVAFGTMDMSIQRWALCNPD